MHNVFTIEQYRLLKASKMLFKLIQFEATAVQTSSGEFKHADLYRRYCDSQVVE